MLKNYMFKIIKTSFSYMAPTIMAAMTLNSCGEKTVKTPKSLVHSFDHKFPEYFSKHYNMSLPEYKPFTDGGILFLGNAIRNTDNTSAYEFDIGVQFYSETEGRRIFIEKMALDTPNLKTERLINEFIHIDKLGKKSNLYWKRLLPLEKINGDSIPLTADFFTLRVDYRLDDSQTKQMSIRFDNTSFWAPNF